MKATHALIIAAMSLGTTALTASADDRQPSKIPSSATFRVESNKRMTFTATHDGIAYVYDHDTDRLVWSGGLLKGQDLSVDPHNDRVEVSGRLVCDMPLTTRDTYRIYFSPTTVEHER